MRSLLAAALVTLAPATALAQGVLVAPTSVFIDARVRTASLLLVNPNDDPAEVEVLTLFGYPITDSLGRLRLHTAEQPDSTEPSAATWVKIFPRRMTIAPKAQQTVRLLVTPPPALGDGEYWTRLIIVARGGRLPITAAGDSGSAVTVGLSVEVRTVIPLLFRKGRVQTGAALSALRGAREGDSLAVRVHVERLGNAAVLGTARGELIDSAGAVRASFTTPFSAYHSIEPRYAAAVGGLPAGQYLLRFEVAPGRSDLPPETVLPFRTVRDSVTVDLR